MCLELDLALNLVCAHCLFLDFCRSFFVYFCFGADFGVITGDLFDTVVHVFGVESDTRSPGVATLCPGRTAFTAGLRQNSNQKM